MSIRTIARDSLHRTVRAVTGKTIFSSNRRLRSLGFHALGARQRLVVCEWPNKETFVASARDEIIGRELFLTGEFDFQKFDAAYQILLRNRGGKRPTVLLDVGANIGPICIPAVARGYVQRAIAVEPEPENCRLLRANIELNNLGSRIVVNEMAAGPADNETLQLELSDYNLGDHRIRAPNGAGATGQSSRTSVTVASRKLDTICQQELSEELLVWIDVQGFEGHVLAGSGAILARRPPLVLEFWPGAMEQSGSFPLLQSNLAGYSGFIDLGEGSRMRPIAELRHLYDELGPGDATTDILVL